MHKSNEEKLFSFLLGEIGAEVIDRKLIEQIWLSDDVDVLGGIYVLFTEKRFYSQLESKFDFDEVFDFLKRYFKVCLIEDPDTDWCDSRLTVCHAISNCIISWKLNPLILEDTLVDFREWLIEIASTDRAVKNYLDKIVFQVF